MGAKRCKGSSDVTVKAGTSSSVTVTAKVSNVHLQGCFRPNCRGCFQSGYTCEVSLADTDGRLVYDASNSGSDGFFIPSGFEPSLYWNFSGTLKKDREHISQSRVRSSLSRKARGIG